jgi:hypothetical protein
LTVIRPSLPVPSSCVPRLVRCGVTDLAGHQLPEPNRGAGVDLHESARLGEDREVGPYVVDLELS